jgi:hypothetical protein
MQVVSDVEAFHFSESSSKFQRGGPTRKKK